MKKVVAIIFCLSFSWVPVTANVNLPRSARALNGEVLTGNWGDLSCALVNPGCAAIFNQAALLTDFQGDQLTNFGLYASPVGTFTSAFGHSPNSIQGSIGYAKTISPNFYGGAQVFFDDSSHISADLGVFFLPEIKIGSEIGLGLWQVGMGLAIANVFNSEFERYQNSGRQIRAGFFWQYFNKWFVKANFGMDAVGYDDYNSFAFNLLLDVSLFEKFSAGVGFKGKSLFVQNQPWVFLGYRHEWQSFYLDFKLTNTMPFSLRETGVSFALGYKFGSDPFEVIIGDLNLRKILISPNFDGENDSALLSLANMPLLRKAKMRDWLLSLEDDKGKTVKTFLSNRLSDKQGYVMLPEAIFWNGSNAQGATVPEGKYKAQIFYVDERQRLRSEYLYSIEVDVTPPQIRFEEEKPAAPEAVNKESNEASNKENKESKEPENKKPQNNQNNKDEMRWAIFFSGEEGEKARLSIQREGGEVVRSWNIEKKGISYVVWDKTDTKAKRALPGNYTAFLTAEDSAKNKVSDSRTFQINSINLPLSIEVDRSSISFKRGDTLNIKFHSPLKFASMNVVIASLNQVIKSYAMNLEREFFTLSKSVDIALEKLPAASYRVFVEGKTSEGQSIGSLSLPLDVMHDAPTVAVKHTPEPISILEKGQEDNFLTFNFSISRKVELKSWSLQILEGNRVFHEFKGKGRFPETMSWDCLNSEGVAMQSLSSYTYRLTVEDDFGNKSQSETIKLNTGIIVESSGGIGEKRNIRIPVSSDGFTTGAFFLTDSIRKMVGDTIRFIALYPTFKIRIEGHTDNVGDAKYNKYLSLKRAEMVAEYMMKQYNVPPSRIVAEGFGSDVPRYENDTDIGRNRNRRVEFVLFE